MFNDVNFMFSEFNLEKCFQFNLYFLKFLKTLDLGILSYKCVILKLLYHCSNRLQFYYTNLKKISKKLKFINIYFFNKQKFQN